MNFLRNFIVLSFVVAMSASLITSCNFTNEDATENQVHNVPEFVNGKAIVLPIGIEEEAEMIAYLEDVTEELVVKLEENHKTASYLLEIGQFEEARKNMKDGMHFSDLDLNLFLTPNQLIEFDRYTPATEAGDERWCGTSTGWCYITTCCGDGGYPICWTTWGIC